MKKSFFLGAQFAGLMLLGGLTVVGCYEGDSDAVDYTVPVTPQLPAAEYKLYCTVEDADGNAVEGATVTIFFNNAEVKTETTKANGSFDPYDATNNGPGLYSLKVEKKDYITVNKPAQQMFKVEDGSVGILNFNVVLKALSEDSGFGVPDVTNEKVSQDIMDNVKTSVIDYLKGQSETPELVKNALDDASTEAIIVDEVVDGKTQKLHATKVVIPVRFEKSQRTVDYVSLAGYEINGSEPVDSWTAQANKYFNVNKKGYTMESTSAILDTQAGKQLMGYNIEMAIVTENLTFNCGANKESITSSVFRPVGSVNVLGIYVNKEPVEDDVVANIDPETQNSILEDVKKSVTGLEVEGAEVNVEGVVSDIITLEVEGTDVDVVRVTVPLELTGPTTDKEVTFFAPISVGYECDRESINIKAVRAIDPIEEWVEQANAYFDVQAPGLKKEMKKIPYNNAAGHAIKGYKVMEYFVVRDLTFECGEQLQEYTGTVKYAYSGELKAVYVDETHDDHHDNGGTAWGGGTTGR